MKKQSNKKDEIVLTKDLVKEITKEATLVASEQFQKQRDAVNESIKDNRLHNAKLLMKKYRWLSDYNNNALYDAAQLCAEGMDDVLALVGYEAGEKHQVDSIRNNVIVTRIIMEHIDTMLDCYKRKCESSKKPEIQRRWRILYKLYLNPEVKPAEEIADEEHISLSMVYTDIDSACKELSTLFFGLDITEFWK